MNIFNVSIKQAYGSYTPIEGQAVRPFRWGELLDERLDEAYLNTVNDPVEHYKPLTELKITLGDCDSTEEMYFIVATDSGQECPVGSGLYKHEIYLIERTKLLEGILCPSLTFTNTLEHTYTSVISTRVYATVEDTLGIDFSGVEDIKTPVSDTKNMTVPSVDYIGSIVLDKCYEKHTLRTFNLFRTESYIKVVAGGNNFKLSENYISRDVLKTVDAISIVYVICIKETPTEQADGSTIGSNTKHEIKVTFPVFVTHGISAMKRWSITDCVLRVLECARPLFRYENPQYTFNGVKYEDGQIKWYDSEHKYRPGSQAEKYDKIIAPEFTMTQCTLREQLKIIGGFIHGEPWLDENDVVHYLDYGNTKSSDAENYPYYYEAGRADINQHCTEIVSNVQNLVSSLGYAKGVVYDPSDQLYRTIRSETVYARITHENGIASTLFPIHSIISVKCGIVNGSNDWIVKPKDITPYVFEETEYSANLSSFAGGYPYSKEYAIYYTIGSKNLSGLFYRSPHAVSSEVFVECAISNILCAVNQGMEYIIKTCVDKFPMVLAFQIAYKPVVSATVSHGKQMYIKNETKYVQVYNQGENLIESQYYGENLKGVVARLGNVERERTFILSRHDQTPKVGEMLGDYAISAVSVEQQPYHYKCTVGLTKDFNRISQYIGINSQKRMYQVSEREAYARNILIRENLVISSHKCEDKIPEGIFFNIQHIKDFFINENNHKISFAEVTTRSKNGEKLFENIFPVMPIALGNTVSFSFNYKDNYSAGDKAQPGEGVSGLWMDDARYTDVYGRAYWLEFYFYCQQSVDSDCVPGKALNIPDACDLSKLIEAQFGTGSVKFYRLRKDNREVPSITVELEIKTNVPGLIIGSAMAEYCKYVSDEYVGSLQLILFRKPNMITKFSREFIPPDDEKISSYYRIEKKPDEPNSSYYYWNVEDVNDYCFKLAPLKLEMPLEQFYGWALVTPVMEKTRQSIDEDGNKIEEDISEGGRIVLASTTPFRGNETIMKDIYFYFSRD